MESGIVFVAIFSAAYKAIMKQTWYVSSELPSFYVTRVIVASVSARSLVISKSRPASKPAHCHKLVSFSLGFWCVIGLYFNSQWESG